MSYCSLEEAWGGKDNSKCSYVENKSNKKKKNVTFNIQNENQCDEHFTNIHNNIELDNTLSCDNYYSFENNDNNNQICNNYLNPPSGILNNMNLNKNKNNKNNFKPPLASNNSILINKNNNDYAPIPSNNDNNIYSIINNDDSYQNNNIMYDNLNYNTEDQNDVDEEDEEDEEENKNEHQGKQSGDNNNVEGFHNSINLDNKMLLDILDRLNAVETQLNSISQPNKNNIHDIILYIIIGIFILFALDSIFRLGRLTV